jgi:hypothetical protein
MSENRESTCPGCGFEITEMMYKINYVEDGVINKDLSEIQVTSHTVDIICSMCCYLLPFKNIKEAMDYLNGIGEE